MAPTTQAQIAPIKSPLIPTLAFLRQHKQSILNICTRHGASNIRIFGSVAREEATPKSDIDFICTYDIEQVTPLFPSSLACELQEFLGFPVDIGFDDALQDQYIGHSVSQDIVEL